MAMLNPEKALRLMRQTPHILRAFLNDVDDARARTLRDGEGGWSILEIVGHMADYEQIFMERARLLLETEAPTFTAYDHEERVESEGYNNRKLEEALSLYEQHRQAFISLLEGQPTDSWQRSGTHPETGATTLLDLAINTGLHDVNHIEQVVKAKGQ